MKKTKFIVISAMLLFFYAGFRPPEGVSKVPIADISFEQTSSAARSVTSETQPKDQVPGK